MTRRPARRSAHALHPRRSVAALILTAAAWHTGSLAVAQSAGSSVPDEEPAVEHLIDGWFSYRPPAGWTVREQASELQRFRHDFAAAPITEPRLQLLLEIGNETTDVFVVREMNFRHVDDELAWRDLIAELVLGDEASLLGTDTVPGRHGPIHRAFYEGDRTDMVASSRVGDQLVAVLASMPARPSDADIDALNSMLASLRFDEQVVESQLLNFHGAWVWLEDDQDQRRIELDYDLPSDWYEVPGDELMQSSADGRAWFLATLRRDDGSSVDGRIADVIDNVLTDGPTDEPFLDDAGSVTVDGFVFTVAAVGGVELDPLVPDAGAAPSGHTGMAAVVIADVGEIDVEIVMVNIDGDPDVGRLFAEIVGSFVVRAWNADGSPVG